MDPIAKALEINLDKVKYGTLAEIGAGQEVARFFFRAGAASGTIAKTMSAYDMIFSDEIYGAEKSGRYVCESRLLKMLDHEYTLLEERLSGKRKQPTSFFVYANTVTTRSYKKKTYSHGWMGVRFQPSPDAAPSDVYFHVNMLDDYAVEQQAAIGILGVNLIYACLYLNDNPRKLIKSLFDSISGGRLEIDTIRFTGPLFEKCDNRIKNLLLVEYKMSNAVMFSTEGKAIPASEMLYNKSIIAFRGAFRPYTNLHQDMLNAGLDEFCNDTGACEVEKTIPIVEVYHGELSQHKEKTPAEFLARLETINAAGYPLLVSNYFEYYRLASYFTRFSDKQIGFILGLRNLLDIFHQSHYARLPGGILESFGVLFNRQAKLYVYPSLDKNSNEILTCESPPIDPSLVYLYKHLYANGYLVDIKSFKKELLSIFSTELVKQIRSGDERWEQFVPDKVAALIKEKNFFAAKN